MLRLSILAVTILAALANPGFAQDGSLLLACDRARSTAELRVFPFPSGTPSVTRIMPERRADCTLANGTTIRVKATPPQSASGPDCDSGGRGFAFSLWVNRQKIYSREEHQVCAGAVLRSLRVGPEGIVHCWYLRGRTLALRRTAPADRGRPRRPGRIPAVRRAAAPAGRIAATGGEFAPGAVQRDADHRCVAAAADAAARGDGCCRGGAAAHRRLLRNRPR